MPVIKKKKYGLEVIYPAFCYVNKDYDEKIFKVAKITKKERAGNSLHSSERSLFFIFNSNIRRSAIIKILKHKFKELKINIVEQLIEIKWGPPTTI